MRMWRCGQCSQTISYRDGMRFCTDCGHALGAPCAACGQEALAGDRHCGFCGVSLAAGPLGPEGPEVPWPSPGPSPELARLVEAARLRAQAAEALPAPPTKAHLAQADVDALFH